MSEVVSLEPEPDASSMGIPKPHERESAEIIDFSSSGNELIMGAFLDDLQSAVEHGKTGLALAVYIENELTAKPDETLSPSKARLQRLLDSGNALGDDALYDHKVEHDLVFQRLITVLQSTKDRQRSLHEHRRAALRLTELRATLPEDETQRDPQWQDLIDRLFT